MIMFDDYALLTSHPLFRGADPDAIPRYLNEETTAVVRVSAGSTAYDSEGTEDRIGMLLCGTAQAFTGANGETALLKTIRAGELFGIANLYAEDEPFPSRIVAISSCEILWIRRDALKAWIEHDPAILRNYLSFQSKKILYLNRKIATLTVGSAERGWQSICWSTRTAVCSPPPAP
jgi:CRP-like cAMP-binding protein